MATADVRSDDEISESVDDGRRQGLKAPVRRCLITQERQPSASMIRFALSPEGKVVPDLAGRLPGRGAWITARREALEQAVRKGAFSRAFRASVAAAPDLPAETERLLVSRCLSGIGLARRSGDLAFGYESVREALRSARPGALIEASDAADDGRGKILALAFALYAGDEGECGIPVITCFSSRELGMALGRERVVHACLAQGRISTSWLTEISRLSGFRAVGRSVGRSHEGAGSPTGAEMKAPAPGGTES
jgi:hypothetical protein